MRNFLLMFVVFLLPSYLFADKVIQDFEGGVDSLYIGTDSSFFGDSAIGVNDTSTIKLTIVNDLVHSGQYAARLDWIIQAFESWGGYAKLEHWHPDTNGVYDFSAYDTISFWVYNAVPSTQPTHVHFRLELMEVSNAESYNVYDVNDVELWYSHEYIVDTPPDSGWFEVKIPLKVVADGQTELGFWLPVWAGIGGNNKLDLDKIKGFGMEFSLDGSLYNESDPSQSGFASGTMYIDDIMLKGEKSVPVIFFNGKSLPSDVTLSAGWSGEGSYEITNEDAAEEGTNSIKWNTSKSDWTLWDGLVFEFKDPKSLAIQWNMDSLHMWIKAPAGIDSLKLVLADDDKDGDGADLSYESFYMLRESEVGFDGTWKELKIPLSAFDRNGGGYNGSEMVYDQLMDSSRVKFLKILVASTNALNKTIYLDQIWTGNPVIDVIPPEAPASIGASPADGYNLVYWEDIEGEEGEYYKVYASPEPITDLADPKVELIASHVDEDIQTAIHYLKYPLKDMDVSYYYAVQCIDAAGNVGETFTAMQDPVTNTAKATATIGLVTSFNFAADGDLSEWDAEKIMPFNISLSNHGAIPIGSFTDDNDLNANVYLAMDNENLYVAIDAIDDSYFFGGGNWWDNDAVEIFIGLYDLRHAPHTSFQRGNEPDYKLYILPDGIYRDPGGDLILPIDNTDLYYENFGISDYMIEAKIPFSVIQLTDDDKVFVPLRGMKIPLDLYFHDNDNGQSEGTMSLSPFNTDHAWQNPSEWTYTWIGDTMYVATDLKERNINDNVKKFELSQNYPNPFNPETTIEFTIDKESLVNLSVYNLLGQKVSTLVNEKLSAGHYKVTFNGKNLNSGIYFYKLDTGSNVKTRKMILLK